MSSLKDTTNASLSAAQNADQAVASLDAMLLRAQILKRKLQVLHEEEEVNQSQSRKRVQHLQELYDISTLADVKYESWSRVRLDRLLVDYLLRAEFPKAAALLAKEQHIEGLVDVKVFAQCDRIANSLRHGETKHALTWCTENRAALKKLGVSRNSLSETSQKLINPPNSITSWSLSSVCNNTSR